MLNQNDLLKKMVLQIIKQYPNAYDMAFLTDKLRDLDPDLLGVLSIFLEVGHLDAYEVQGYTPQKLINEHGMSPIAAIFTLDWLIREPDRARLSLERGHDSIKSS